MGDPNSDAESTAEHYTEETKALEAQDTFVQTKDRIANPPSAKEAQAKHEADLEKRAEEAVQRAKEAEDKISTANAEAKKEAETAALQARQEADAAKQALTDQRFDMLSTQLQEALTKSAKSPQEAFSEYFDMAEMMGSKMGWAKPGATMPASDNPQIALELAKLGLESAREDRKFQMEMENSKRKWDMDMLEMKDNRTFKERELQLQEKKDQQLFTLPEIIGGAIAKGMREQGGPAVGGGVQQQQRRTYKTTVEPGQAGHIECPECQNSVEITANARAAECQSCHTPFIIERKPAQEEE